MADKKDETEEKGKKGGMMGLLIPMVGGGLGVFLLTIPIVLFSQGIIQLEGPQVKAPESYIIADTLLARHYKTEGLLSDEGLAILEAREEEMAAEATRLAEAEAARILKEQEDERMAILEAERAAALAAAPPPEPEASAVTAAQTTSNNTQVAVPAEQNLPFEQEKLTRLVKVYEKMRAKQVAMILDTMSDTKSAMILANMKDKNAAEVLAAIDAKKAARLSELIVRMSTSD